MEYSCGLLRRHRTDEPCSERESPLPWNRDALLDVGVITDSLTRCAAWARYADLVMNSGSFSWVTHVSEKCFSTSLKYPSTVIKVGGYQLLTCFLCRCSLIMTCSGWKAYP